MSLVQLPANVLPSHPNGVTSPLGRYLTTLLNASNGVPFDATSSAMEACLGLAMAHPFDPQERVAYGRNPVQDCSLVGAVVRATNANTVQLQHRSWPETIDGFGAQLLEGPGFVSHRPLQIDNEWVAAALTAVGCSAWDDAPLHAASALPYAVQGAAQMGMAGLLERFLKTPGAWSAQRVADAPFVTRSGEQSLGWVALASKKEANLSLEVLVRNGARLTQEKAIVATLVGAYPQAVAALAPTLPALSEAAQRKVQEAWKERVVSRALEAQDAQSMSQVLWGAKAPEVLSAASTTIGQYFSEGWGSTPNGSKSQAYDFATNQGAEKLIAQARVKAGPMAGQWSVLAAAAFSRVRQGDSFGALGWNASAMLSQVFHQEERKYILASPNKAPYKGSLAPALGFDWRPGIRIDGLVVLALMGQRGEGLVRYAGQKNDMEDGVQDHIRGFQAAAGIGNLERWVEENLPAAARATQAMVKGNASSAGVRLLHAWFTLINRTEAFEPWQALSEEERFGVIYGVTAKFQGSDPWTLKEARQVASITGMASENERAASMFQTLVDTFFPGAYNLEGLQDQAPDSLGFKAALVANLALTRSTEHHEKVFEHVHRVYAQLPKQTVELLETWLDTVTSLGSERRLQFQAVLKQWALEHRLSPAAPTSSPRLRL